MAVACGSSCLNQYCGFRALKSVLGYRILMKRLITDLLVLASGILSVLYLLNIGLGVVEIIPDNIPIIGNLDEVMATLLLLRCLAYFGIDITHLVDSKTGKFKRKPPTDRPGQ
jgi:hypothetical protein